MIRAACFACTFFCCSFIAVAAHAQPLRPPELPAPANAQPSSEPGYLGLIADDKQEEGRGARLRQLIPDSPAAEAGLLEGDLIVAINGHAITSLDEMGAVLKPLPPGAKVAFDIERHGQKQTVSVVLGNRPPPEQRKYQKFGKIEAQDQSSGPQNPSATQTAPPIRYSDQPDASAARPALLGIKTLPVDEATRMRLRLQSAAGALVIARTLGSPAEKAGIPLDAVVVAVNGQAVANPNELSAQLAQAGAGKTIELTYIWNGEPIRSNVTLGMASTAAARPMAPPQGGAASDIGRRPIPPQGANGGSAPPQRDDNQQIQMLEQRVRELEQRVRQLEDQIQRRT